MKFYKFGVVCSLALLPLTMAVARASDNRGLNEALASRNDLISNLKNEQFGQPTQQVLNTLVETGLAQLRVTENPDDTTLADQLDAEWSSHFSASLTGPSIMGLGDHRPLLRWLANFYDSLHVRIGAGVQSIAILEDLNTMNYAIPIVFTPRGTWRVNDGNDWVEYRKHFIPFANVLTYWVSFESCLKATSVYAPILRRVCNPAAMKLHQIMGRRIAPAISDFIFNHTNHSMATLEFSDEDLEVRNGDELRAAIQLDGGLL